MKYCKPRKTPFISGVKLEELGSFPMVNNTLYRQLIGCFLYLTHTQPNLSYAVSVASRYMDHPLTHTRPNLSYAISVAS